MKSKNIYYPPQIVNIIAGIMASKDACSPNYLKGPQLVNIFQSLGFPDSYTFADGRGIQTIDFGEGLSRLTYTTKRLEEINKSFQIPNAIKLFIDNVQAPKEALQAINEVLNKFNFPPVDINENNISIKSTEDSVDDRKTNEVTEDVTINKFPMAIEKAIQNVDSKKNEQRRIEMEKSILGDIPSGRPVVFISYSWDSEMHKKWVAKLADDLTKAGIYVLLDQYLEDGTILPIFMELGILRADKVIVIGTKIYKQKSYHSNTGAAFEDTIIRIQMFNNLGTKKFITCLREGNFEDSFPMILGGCKGHDFTCDENYLSELDSLCHEIWCKPKHQRPQLGDIPDYAK